MSIINEVAERQTHDEAIEALRAQVEARTKERDELLWVLRWNLGELSDDEMEVAYKGDTLYTNSARITEILNKYATTAPTSTGA